MGSPLILYLNIIRVLLLLSYTNTVDIVDMQCGRGFHVVYLYGFSGFEAVLPTDKIKKAILLDGLNI